jgi:hypothetical protein
MLLGVAVLIVGSGLRLYNLSVVPHGLTWDEVAIGYSGWSVWETRRDEWLDFLPISFRSYGDYKAPFAVYLVGFFTQFMGLTELTVRLPFALISSLSIAVMGWLGYEWIKYFFPQTQKSHLLGYGVLSMMFLAFSPWHLHLSRIGFESGIALGLVIFGLASWFRMINTQNIRWIFIVAFCFVLALYTYHSAKIVVPLLGLILVSSNWRFLIKKIRWLLGTGVFAIAGLSPLLYDTFFGMGGSRFSQTSIFSLQINELDKIKLFVTQYLLHLHPDFLVLGKVENFRQGMGEIGVLLPITFFLVLLSVFVMFFLVVNWTNKSKVKYSSQNQQTKPALKSLFLSWSIVLVSILPGAIGLDEAPHTIRSLLGLSGFTLIALSTSKILMDYLHISKINQIIKGNHGEANIALKAVIGTSLLLHLLSAVVMTNYYFNDFAQNSAQLYVQNYLEVMRLTQDYATGNNGKSKKDKILISTTYGQPHMYTLFANQIHPFAYNSGFLIKYEFVNPNVGDLIRENALVVVANDTQAFNPDRATQLIYDDYGNLEFMIFETNN